MNQPSKSLPTQSTNPPATSPPPEESRDSDAPGALPLEPSSDAGTALQRFRSRVAAKQSGPDDIDDEQTLWHGGYSAKAMGGVWLSAIIATIALIAVAIFTTFLPWEIAVGIAAVAWLAAGLFYTARRLGIHYELTTQRILHQHGVLSRRTDRIEVIDIEDVSFLQGPIERFWGIGTIDISSTDRSHPHLVMPGIADVKTVAGLIDDVRRRERQRRSLHIRSM